MAVLTVGASVASGGTVACGEGPGAVIKVSHGSFDTHSNQLGHHERLLKELAESLVTFRQALTQAELWDLTLMMIYSEFGRRIGENASAGTDHGRWQRISFWVDL